MQKGDGRTARERLFRGILAACTLDEVLAAKEALSTWLDAHPDDVGMEDAFEILSHREEAAVARQTAGLASRSESLEAEITDASPQLGVLPSTIEA
jgi:hypothetical protein